MNRNERSAILIATGLLSAACGAGMPAMAATSATSTLVGVGSAKCVEVRNGSSSLSAVIQQSSCTGAAYQSFNLVPSDSGYYYVKNANSGLCLNVSGRSTANGAGILQWNCGVAARNDQFKPQQNPDGSYVLIARHSGLCLDVPSHSTASGTALDQWSCNGGTNQAFQIAGLAGGPVPTPTPTPSPVPTPSPSPTPVPSPTPPPVTGNAIRVLQWNVEDGEQAGEITEVVNQRPQIAFLEEVDRVQHIDDIRAALEADQGVPFYKVSVNRDGSASGASNIAIISRYPLSNVKTLSLGSEGEVICGISTNARAAIGATITVNGKAMAVFGVRTYYDSSSCVSQTQVRKLKAWASANYGGMTQLFGGDFNMSPGSAAYNASVDETAQFADSWYQAVLDRTATAYTTVSFTTPTRSSRLDYLFFVNAGAVLSVQDANIPALTPYSDHRQMITDFIVR